MVSFCNLIVMSRSLISLSNLTILVLVAFSSRLRKLILAVSGDNVAALVFFLAGVLGTCVGFEDAKNGGALTFSDVIGEVTEFTVMTLEESTARFEEFGENELGDEELGNDAGKEPIGTMKLSASGSVLGLLPVFS